MNYEREIIRVLTEAGDKGLKAGKISRHVFNACNSMFAPADYEHVRQYVRQYLYRNSFLVSHPFIQRIGWGCYRLDPKAKKDKQRIFPFSDDDASSPDSPDFSAPIQHDNSLSLFGEEV